jgi:hypothetical protein
VPFDEFFQTPIFQTPIFQAASFSGSVAFAERNVQAGQQQGPTAPFMRDSGDLHAIRRL